MRRRTKATLLPLKSPLLTSGPGDATNVDLTDLIPVGLTETVNNGGVTQGTYDAATGLFSIGTLLVGETATLTIEGTVNAGEGGNVITNVTTAATGDQVDPSTVGDDLEESVAVGIPAADLVTVKTLASGRCDTRRRRHRHFRHHGHKQRT